MDTIRYHGWFCNTTWGALTEDERHHNGMRLAQGLYNFGWTEEAIAGILGNVEPESGLSPATMEGNPYPDYIPSNTEVLDDTSYYGGLGWVQWTPGRTELVQWAEDNHLVWYDGTTQIKRFKYEYDNNLEWPYWKWYARQTSPPEDCAEFFCRRYCRPYDPDATVGNRRAAGLRWYDEIHDRLHHASFWFVCSKRNREEKLLKPPIIRC